MEMIKRIENGEEVWESASNDLLRTIFTLRAEVARLQAEARWIPTAERMPEDYTLVLVAAPHVVEHVRLAEHLPSCDHGCAFWRSRVNGCAITVTHWRPLPALPQPEVQP